MCFFDASWKHIGSRRTLAKDVWELTGIPEWILRDGYQADGKASKVIGLANDNNAGDEEIEGRGLCVAERLSWASNRMTTRGEDRAYRLMVILPSLLRYFIH